MKKQVGEKTKIHNAQFGYWEEEANSSNLNLNSSTIYQKFAPLNSTSSNFLAHFRKAVSVLFLLYRDNNNNNTHYQVSHQLNRGLKEKENDNSK
jgi:hypothetical protein